MEQEFLERYKIVIADLQTDDDFAIAAFKICNGYYETADNVHNHLKFLFELRSTMD